MNYNLEYHDKVVLGSDLYSIHPHLNRLVLEGIENQVLPYADMQVQEQHLCFIYDHEKKCIAPASIKVQENGARYSMVRIPEAVMQLRHKCSLWENEAINAQSVQEKMGFQMLGLRYTEKMLGMTPKIMIDGQAYYFKLDDRTLGRSFIKPEILLDDSKQAENGKDFLVPAFYDQTINQFVHHLDMTADKKAPNFLIRIPPLKVLDPVGYALRQGKKGYCYLNQYPLGMASTTLYQQVSVQQSKLLRASGAQVTALPGYKGQAFLPLFHVTTAQAIQQQTPKHPAKLWKPAIQTTASTGIHKRRKQHL